MREVSGAHKRFLLSLAVITGLCLALFLFRALTTGVFRYVFIPQNLALAWAAFLFSWLLVTWLQENRWLSWQGISLSVLWLFFLPNTWYVLTDFLHIDDYGEISLLYDFTLILTLVITGFVLGFTSLYLVHKELLKRWSVRAAHTAVAGVLAIASFAIYLGRDLRWNSWDVVTNPGGVIINVSDRVIDPFEHFRAINVTVLFFILLGVLYAALWIATGPHRVKRR